MDKNTLIAILLSFIVIFGYMLFQQKYVLPKQQALYEAKKLEQQAEPVQEQNSVEDKDVFTTEESLISIEKDEVELEEVKIVTKKAEIVLTSKGGDIKSYCLTEHMDNETGCGVEMVDNITDYNRAFSLSLGNSNNKIINENFKVKRFDPVDGNQSVAFYKTINVKDSDGNEKTVTIGKRYTFADNDYVFKLDISLLSDDEGFSFDGNSYTIRTSPQIGPHYDKKKDRYEVRQFISLNGSKRTKKMITDKTYNLNYEWAGVGGKYFTILVKPSNPSSMTNELRTSDRSLNGYTNSQLFLTRTATNASNTTDTYYVYVGPRSETELIKYNSIDKNAWGLSNVKFNQALQTSGMLSFIEIFLKWGLEIINKVAHNWGVSIIILTFILKIILFPLNKKTAVSSIKMQQLQPRLQELQNKYKDNQPKLQEETMKLYKEGGANPMGGCLPMVIQMIVLFAMYNMFNNYFEFRGASFIKGWIDDLSTGDAIWSWERNIPFISGFTMNTLRILPFVYTISQLVSGKITQYGGAASTAGQSKTQMNMMMYGMPIMFFFLFYNVPSGLLLYWTTSNILQIGQQLIINNITKKKMAEIEKNKPQVNKNVLKFKNGKKKTR